MELCQSITSLSQVITEQERKIEYMKMVLDNEVNKLTELQDNMKSFKTEQKLISKAQKVVNFKKRRVAVDGFNDQLDNYINEHEDGKCQYINDRNRKCTKKSAKELDQMEYCVQHYTIMAEAKLNSIQKTQYGN
jgi:phage/plasmid-associated DNA primase